MGILTDTDKEALIIDDAKQAIIRLSNNLLNRWITLKEFDNKIDEILKKFKDEIINAYSMNKGEKNK